MEPFQQHTGIVALLDSSNVDTDQIIPKQFLKSIRRTGFGEFLFFDWRFLANGKPNPEFSLNDPACKNASILVTRNNFGCGSSREHAVWAIQQYGIRVIIACSKYVGGQTTPAFADIFRNNCVKNAVLTVELSERQVDEIFQKVQKQKDVQATVDLEKQNIVFHFPSSLVFSFDLDPSIKKRLIQGLDDIGLTLKHQSALDRFEKTHSPQLAKR